MWKVNLLNIFILICLKLGVTITSYNPKQTSIIIFSIAGGNRRNHFTHTWDVTNDLFHLQDITMMAAQNSSQFTYQECLATELPTEVQQQILNIGSYVFRPLSFTLAFLSLVLNMLVVIVVARNRSLQHPSMIMICSLAVTDVIFSLYSMYRYIEIFTHEQMCPKSHPLHSALSALCSLATLGNLAVISRDRYMAVRSPWWYRNHATKPRAFKELCIPWLISVVTAVVVYFSKTLGGVYQSLAQVLTLVFFAFCVIFIIFCYLSIHTRKPIEVGNPNDSLFKKEKRLTNTVAWVLLILLLTYFPALLFPILLFAKGFKNFLPFRPYYIIFIQLNGALNPLLNFGRSKKMRKAIRDLFKCIPQVQPSSFVKNNNENNNNANNNNNNNINNNSNNGNNLSWLFYKTPKPWHWLTEILSSQFSAQSNLALWSILGTTTLRKL